jgi:glycosyltransferase involved in cell wall biosynthesis
VKSLHYLADVRVPTEKAHGWQIVKMCEALAMAGSRVELWTPRRRQPYDNLVGETAFSYYGVPHSFEHRVLPNIDLVRLELRLPARVARSAIVLNSVGWSASAVHRASRQRVEQIYTRDLSVAYWANRAHIPLLFEAHAMPGPRSERVWRRITGSVRVVALTPFIAEEFGRLGIAPDRLIVEGDAVDLGPFESLPARREAKVKIGLNPDAVWVGYLGQFHRFDEERGLPELLRAFARVVDSHPAAGLVCVGGPMDRVPRYRTIAVELGLDPQRVRFVDRVSNVDVPTWLAAFDVAVMPATRSRHFSYETSPLKVFEYLAAGLPIVAGDLPATRLVLRDGENALLVEPESPAAMGEGISRLLSDTALAERLGSNGRLDVQGMTWAARAERILRFAGSREKANA